MLSAGKVKELYRRLAEVIVPEPELHFSNRLELLIAVMLSAQTTDKAVNAVTAKLFAQCRKPEDYLALGQTGIEAAISSIGLYRNKSKALLKLCELLIEQHGGEVPGTMEELTALPGVGTKTARVVLNLGFGVPVIAVDTHIFRVANRTGLAPENTPDAVSGLLLKRTPAKYRLNAHHYLLLHGRYTCTAKKPHCDKCVLRDGLCLRKGLPAEQSAQ